MFMKSKAAKLRSDDQCSREAFREVPQSAIYIFSLEANQPVSGPHSHISCFWFGDTETVYSILQTNGKTAVLPKDAQRRFLLAASRGRTQPRPSHQRPEGQKRRWRKILSSRNQTSAHMYSPDKCQAKSSVIHVWHSTQLSFCQAWG